ncbi:hypothetical protein QPK87_10950 [Kamptonema cortianum]|nr:hypothetical protein [Geitlerinema splendidum]MDK3157092.1 hypothetical protein [Kamptonema cortianum]
MHALLVSLIAPLVVTQAGSIRHVAVADFAYVLKTDGTVYGWGYEEHPLGLRPAGSHSSIKAPTLLAFPKNFRKIYVSSSNGYGVTDSGQLYAWGDNGWWQLGNHEKGPEPPAGQYGKDSVSPVLVPAIDNVVQVAPTLRYVLALDSAGQVMSWGSMGDGTRSKTFAQPVVVKGLPPIKQIAASTNHCLALDTAGNVWAWGDKNDWGELGHNRLNELFRPTKVEGLANVVSIAAGGGWINASGAVKSDGTVWVWGGNQSGMMGNGKNPVLGEPGSINRKPIQVKGITNAKAIRMGSGHVGVILGDGTLRMWGHDGWGQIGVGTSGYYQLTPKQPKITNVKELYIGGNKNIAVKSDGTLWFWGPGFRNGTGTVGRDHKVPVQVILPK